MDTLRLLHDPLETPAFRGGNRYAAVDRWEAIEYSELATLANRTRNRLYAMGVRPGDRVGIYLRKSIDGLAAILGTLKCGAAYVPLDPRAPAYRNALIIKDCSMRAAVVEERFESELDRTAGPTSDLPAMLVLPGVGGGQPLRVALGEPTVAPPDPESEHTPRPDDLAAILYTSGSTGSPKGVMLSHGNMISFVDWCSSVFSPGPADRFASHAPFHFDLSILDIYLALKHGATLYLVEENTGKKPGALASWIADNRITIWYSTPSVLSLLAHQGNLEQHDLSALRLVLFAGEVFPIKPLRLLKSILPAPNYFNLFGPTETNVCTYYKLPRKMPADRQTPFPIGTACAHCQIQVVDVMGNEVVSSAEGEMMVTGPSVMQGYWDMEQETSRVFRTDDQGVRWYRTGDLVSRDGEGNFLFLGRKDRMVKRRGYRIELGELEAVLGGMPRARETGVISLPDEEWGVRITAFLSFAGGACPGPIEMKTYCAERLPLYMIPDQFITLDTLPRTSTGKVDYQKLKELN